MIHIANKNTSKHWLQYLKGISVYIDRDIAGQHERTAHVAIVEGGVERLHVHCHCLVHLTFIVASEWKYRTLQISVRRLQFRRKRVKTLMMSWTFKVVSYGAVLEEKFDNYLVTKRADKQRTDTWCHYATEYRTVELQLRSCFWTQGHGLNSRCGRRVKRKTSYNI